MLTLIVENETPPYKKIDFHLKRSGQTQRWVARNTDTCFTNLCLVLNGRKPLSEKLRKKINELLETDY